VRQYLQCVADRRLAHLGIEPLYGSSNPLAFMDLQCVRYQMKGMTPDETASYIRHHLEAAGRTADLFTRRRHHPDGCPGGDRAAAQRGGGQGGGRHRRGATTGPATSGARKTGEAHNA
jgi:hypothetical protein